MPEKIGLSGAAEPEPGAGHHEPDLENRFLESRAAVMTQFEELAGILEEFSGQMEQALDVTMTWEGELKTALRKRRIDVEGLLVLQYGQGRREVFMTARMTNGRCMTARDASEAIAKVMKGSFSAARDGKAIITRNPASFRFIEDGRYRILFGSSRVPRDGEEVSGDSYTFKSAFRPGHFKPVRRHGQRPGGQRGQREGHGADGAASGHGLFSQVGLKLVNTVLLLTGQNDRPATLDLCLVDLYSGVAEAMKLGAVASFIMGRDGVEVLESEHVPAGVMNPVEPVMISKKLWDGDRIVMVSDGILDAMPGAEKEAAFTDFLAGLPAAGPQETAEMIMAFALSFDGEPRDDMTVLVGGIYGR